MSEYKYQVPDLGQHAAYVLPQLLSLIASERPLTILDIGCGNGSIAHAIARKGHNVTGVDSSSSAIEVATTAYADYRFLQSKLPEMPEELRDEKFDLVISIETIEHLIDPRSLVRVAHRFLKSDGRLIVSTPYHGYFKNLVLALSGKMDQHFTVLWDGGHVKFFSKRTLRLMLEQEGFEVLRFKFAGRLPWLWKSMFCIARPAS